MVLTTTARYRHSRRACSSPGASSRDQAAKAHLPEPRARPPAGPPAEGGAPSAGGSWSPNSRTCRKHRLFSWWFKQRIVRFNLGFFFFFFLIKVLRVWFTFNLSKVKLLAEDLRTAQFYRGLVVSWLASQPKLGLEFKTASTQGWLVGPLVRWSTTICSLAVVLNVSVCVCVYFVACLFVSVCVFVWLGNILQKRGGAFRFLVRNREGDASSSADVAVFSSEPSLACVAWLVDALPIRFGAALWQTSGRSKHDPT